MAVNPKQSKYRYLTGTPGATATDLTHVQPSSAVWDQGSFIAANAQYIAVPWAAVGATAVFDMKDYGNCPAMPPLLAGHGGPILDLSFHPYENDLLFTASEDATICGWRIPEGGLKDSKNAPIIQMTGHSRKVGTMVWHPSAANVLASAGPDPQVRLWDVTCATPKADLRAAKDAVFSINFNLDGTLLNTTTKDKRVNVVDSRTGDIVISSESHESSKTQRSVWAKRRNLIITTGFTKKQQREVKVWDLRQMDQPTQVLAIDNSPCVMAPYFDEDTDILFAPGKGESSVNFFHLWMEDTPLNHVNAYRSTTDQKGFAFLPKMTVNVKEAEIIGSVKLSTKSIQKIRWVVPRKTSHTEFQADLYPLTFANRPAITADEFFAGKNAEPSLTSLEGKFTGGECETVAGNKVQDSAAVSAHSNAPAAHRGAATNGVHVAPAAAQPAAATWDGVSVPSDDQLKTQSAYVAHLMDLAKKLEHAQTQYVQMAAKKPDYKSSTLDAVHEARTLAASVSMSLETPKKDKKDKKDKSDKSDKKEKKDKSDKKEKKDKHGDEDDEEAAKAKAAKKLAVLHAAARQDLCEEEEAARKFAVDDEASRRSIEVKTEAEGRAHAKEAETARLKREAEAAERKRKEAEAAKSETSSSSSSSSDSSDSDSDDSASSKDKK